MDSGKSSLVLAACNAALESGVMATAKLVLAAKLQELRAKAGLSQEELAHEAGVSRAYLSELERGHKEAGIQVLVRLASALSVEPGKLLKGAELPPTALPRAPRKRRSRVTPAERLGRLVTKLAEGADHAALKRFATVARAFFPQKR